MKRAFSLLLAVMIAALCAGCGSVPSRAATAPADGPEPEQPPAESPVSTQETESAPENGLGEWNPETESTDMNHTLNLAINATEVAVDWEDNASVEALTELVSSSPLTVQMSMYGGFEQVGSLGTALPRNDSRTTTQAGDIVLYSGDQIVVFYGSNFWAYTRLGRITDKSPSELAELLGNGDVTLALSLK